MDIILNFLKNIIEIINGIIVICKSIFPLIVKFIEKQKKKKIKRQIINKMFFQLMFISHNTKFSNY